MMLSMADNNIGLNELKCAAKLSGNEGIDIKYESKKSEVTTHQEAPSSKVE